MNKKDFPVNNNPNLGVKLTDDVLANELSFKIVSLIIRAAGANAESIRTKIFLLPTPCGELHQI
jgi:uncharacterized membrane protein